MRRAFSIFAATALLAATLAAPSPARADPWWFVAGAIFGAVTAPAYGYPYGFRSGYAPVPAVAPWAVSPQECHWAKVQQNGAWRHARICYETSAPPVEVRYSEPIVRK